MVFISFLNKVLCWHLKVISFKSCRFKHYLFILKQYLAQHYMQQFYLDILNKNEEMDIRIEIQLKIFSLWIRSTAHYPCLLMTFSTRNTTHNSSFSHSIQMKINATESVEQLTTYVFWEKRQLTIFALQRSSRM